MRKCDVGNDSLQEITELLQTGTPQCLTGTVSVQDAVSDSWRTSNCKRAVVAQQPTVLSLTVIVVVIDGNTR